VRAVLHLTPMYITGARANNSHAYCIQTEYEVEQSSSMACTFRFKFDSF
jgi:hypothetical protein